eukprot:307023-Rhodomonas_salina.1
MPYARVAVRRVGARRGKGIDSGACAGELWDPASAEDAISNTVCTRCKIKCVYSDPRAVSPTVCVFGLEPFPRTGRLLRDWGRAAAAWA